jgi:hypothetical protein
MNETKRFQCRHIFTDKRRCASPCLRGEEFCYYHHTTRTPIANPKQRRTRQSTFHLPLPEDRSAIESSIGEVLRRIATNEIDPRRAGLLLYGLQIASLNLPAPAKTVSKASPHSYSDEHEAPTPDEHVEEIVIDPTLGTLAPRTEIHEAEQPLSTVAASSNDSTNRPYPSPTPNPTSSPKSRPPHLSPPTNKPAIPTVFVAMPGPFDPQHLEKPIHLDPFSRNVRSFQLRHPQKDTSSRPKRSEEQRPLHFAVASPRYLPHQPTLVS